MYDSEDNAVIISNMLSVYKVVDAYVLTTIWIPLHQAATEQHDHPINPINKYLQGFVRVLLLVFIF